MIIVFGFKAREPLEEGVGLNGSGKSTLALVLAGCETYDVTGEGLYVRRASHDGAPTALNAPLAVSCSKSA